MSNYKELKNMNESSTKKSQEEMDELAKERKKEWDDFLSELASKSDEPLTKGEFIKALEFITGDIQGIGEMASYAMYNMNVLNSNFQHLVSVLQGGKSPVVNKTKSGIIIP
jgi:ATP phosphoribosyltransferase